MLLLPALLIPEASRAQSQIELRARDVRGFADYLLRFQQFYEPALAAAAAAKEIERVAADLAAGALTQQAAGERSEALHARAAGHLGEIDRAIADGRYDPPAIRNPSMRDPVLAMREGIDAMRKSVAGLVAGAQDAFAAAGDGDARATRFDVLIGLLELENRFIALSGAGIWDDHPQKALNEAMSSLNAKLIGMLDPQRSDAAARSTDVAIGSIERGRLQVRQLAQQVKEYVREAPRAAEIAKAFEAAYLESFAVEHALAGKVDTLSGRTADRTEIERMVAPLIGRRVALYSQRLASITEVERIIR
ncbi:MAG: hypothetical protein WDZ63_15765 [Burkholderiales bacterium]